MHRKKYATLLIFLLCFTSETYTRSKAAITVASVGISVAGIYAFYHWLRTPEKFNPSIDNLNTLTIRHTKEVDQDTLQINIDQLVERIHKRKTPQKAIIPAKQKKLLVEKGLTTTSDDPTLFILSRGYARTNKLGTNDNFIQRGGCAVAAHMPIQDDVINHAPCITFDYPDRRRCFSFAQKTDLECLKTIYTNTLQKNPDAHIILIGDCRGAKAALSFAATKPDNLNALVIFSPFMSARELTEQVAHNYLSWLPHSSDLLYGFFKLYFPNYNEKEDNITDSIAHIEKELPIFIGHRKGDTLVTDEQILNMVDFLRKTGHTHIHFIAVDDKSAPHSRLTPNKEIQRAVNEFFYTYGLPYKKGFKYIQKPIF